MEKRLKILLMCFAIITVIVGCVAVNKRVAANWHKGRDYYYYESLGQPFNTGIPYSLWLAMMRKYPAELGATWGEVEKNFGLVRDASKSDGLPVGFSITQEPLTDSPFLMTNCSLCHTAEINGRIIHGLGARNLQLNKLNNTIMGIARRGDFLAEELLPIAKAETEKQGLSWGIRTRIVVKAAIKELKKRAAEDVAMDAGPGRNTPIEFAKKATHVEVERPYGYVRFPAVWTYPKRKTFGWDASMHGDLALAAASVEFNKGMSPEYIVQHQDKWNDIYAYVARLKAPSYPGVINNQLAKQGKKIYRDNCQSCHGAGDYSEKVIPIEEIGTDSDRLIAMNNSLATARNATSFGKIVPLQTSNGYVAPPLDGIWSRAPYLHNGSVPTLYDLLQSTHKRPTTFYVGAGVGYDLVNIGLQRQPDSLDAYKFDTNGAGNKNIGHEYGAALSEKEKRALLEYLKTL